MTRLIDADKLPNIYTATHQEMIMSFEEAPTVEAIPIEWIRKWMDRQNSWNLEGVITLMREWAERKEE